MNGSPAAYPGSTAPPNATNVLPNTPADPDAALRDWLRIYAEDYPRRGFRPAYHDARAEGWIINHKKIQRLWREEGLRVPVRRRRKRHGTSAASLRNGCVESFNSRIRDECLNINSFWSLAQARGVISDWKHDYNHNRGHASLGYQPSPLCCQLFSPLNDSRSASEEFTSPVGVVNHP